VTRFATLVQLAVRELWITFRLLAMLAALLLSGMAAALLPDLLAIDPQLAYGAALAGSALACAGISAVTLASERRAGSVAWLSVRAVPRATLLHALLAALAMVALTGLVVSASVAWLAVSQDPAASGGAFAAACLAIAALLLLALALGLLCGALLPPAGAATVAFVLLGAVLLPALLLSPSQPGPAGGIALLMQWTDADRPVTTALQSCGLALILSAVLVAAATAALRRDDL
jgi:hypothetical protein